MKKKFLNIKKPFKKIQHKAGHTLTSITGKWKNLSSLKSGSKNSGNKSGPSPSKTNRFQGASYPPSVKAWLSDETHRPRVERFTKIALWVIGLHFLAAMISMGLEWGLPDPPPPMAQRTATRATTQTLNTQTILNRHLFNRRGLNPDVDGEVIIAETGQPVEDTTPCTREKSQSSSLPYRLSGTIVLSNRQRSVATFTEGNQIFPLREGERLRNDLRLDEIKRLSVAFKNLRTNNCEFYEIRLASQDLRSAPVRPTAAAAPTATFDGITQERPNQFKIERDVLSQFKNNPQQFLTQALAVPVMGTDGQLAGFRVEQLMPDSPFAALGIQRGDMLTGMNGSNFQDMNQVFEMFENMDQISRLEISVDRNGQPLNLVYEVE